MAVEVNEVLYDDNGEYRLVVVAKAGRFVTVQTNSSLTCVGHDIMDCFGYEHVGNEVVWITNKCVYHNIFKEVAK